MANNNFPFSPKEAIRKRTSVRTFKEEALPWEVEIKLKNYAEEIKGPFAPALSIIFINQDKFARELGGRIGTYGVIKGAKNFAGALVEEGLDKNLEQVGYVMEEFILFATHLGIGTCWLGGTFKINGLERIVKLDKEEFIPIITPLGYPAGGKSLVERAMKAAVGSKKRKPWHKLFFDGSLDSPLQENEAGFYRNPLEMVRLAPSASNRQPWRLVKEGPCWHFFMDYSMIVNQAAGIPIQRVDMGIAMAHFELTAGEEGLSGEWVVKEEKPSLGGIGKLHYIATWRGQGRADNKHE